MNSKSGFYNRYFLVPKKNGPTHFTKCTAAVLSPLRQMGIHIINYLDDWLVLARLEQELIDHKSLLLSHLERLGLINILAKNSLSPSELSSRGNYRFCKNAGMNYVRMLPDCSAACSVIQTGDFMFPLDFPEDAWPHVHHFVCDLTSSFASKPMSAGKFLSQGNPPLHQSCGPFENSLPVSIRHPVGTDLHEEGGNDRCLQLGLGSSVRRRPAFGSWSNLEQCLTINCLKMMAGFSSPKKLPA